ncbi:MAG TPA: TetR/AcrR family transcriptional regulator [Thermoanaerobaculia bacterium]|nr:TetR/AcrR family transcriptional regulator [Thermoanaerobaculia bacterium]
MCPEVTEHSVEQRLLDAAIQLFTERGYTATSVRELVERAGVTKPALYYHFASKEDLYLAILSDLARYADEVIARSRVRSGPVRERLEKFLVAMFEAFEEKKSAVRLINAVFWGPAQGAPPFDFATFHNKLLVVLREIVDEGIAAGELRAANPADMTLALMGVLSFTMDLTLARPELGVGKDGLRRALDLLFAGLAAPGPAFKETPR